MREYDTAQRVFSAILDDKANTDGDRPFILAPETVTLAELRQRVRLAAGGLAALGVTAGDPVLIVAPNSVELIVAIQAVGWIGAVEVPVNTAYRGATMSHVVNDSCARIAIVADELLDVVDAALTDDSRVERIVVIGGSRPGDSRTVSWEQVCSGPAIERYPAKPSDLMAMMYTSGTTGPSKGVMVTHHHAYQYSAPSTNLVADREVIYVTLPLFHIGGQWAGVLSALLTDGQIVVRDRFSVSEFWHDVDRWGVTQTILLGVMAEFLYKAPPRADDATHTLRRVSMAPVLAEAWEFMKRFNVRINQGYGMTELGCVMAAIPPDEPVVDPWCCGRPRDQFYEVKLVDEHGHTVPRGQAGELLVRPKVDDIIMKGYWRNADATVAAWANLWFHTGDSLIEQDDGSYRFVSRLSDSIRRRGENISAYEIEREALRHPAVATCAAVPARSEFAEEEIKLCVELVPGTDLTPQELLEFLAPLLPAFMLPRFIDIRPELPVTPTGKIQKSALRCEGTATSWDRSEARNS